MPVKHVWQKDNGFQKTRILNKALLTCSHHNAVFTDGDCIPRHDFLAAHNKHKSRARFLSGGYFKLPLETSLALKNYT